MIRVVFMGSADLSAVMLERLTHAPDVQVVGVVTQPDKPAGRSKKLTPCACKAFVNKANIPCLTPEKVNTVESLAQIAAWMPDVIVVVAYGQFLSKRLLDIPMLGCINIHLSLLPRYRGASPIHAALLAGDRIAGVSAMLMDEGMDSGPVLMTMSTAVTADDTCETLHDRLTELGAELLVKVLPLWAYFKVKPVPQDASKVVTAYKIKKSDGMIRWTEPSEVIWRKIRAYNPWPSTYTYLPSTGKEAGKTLKILKAEVVLATVEPALYKAGQIIESSKNGILVRTGDGILKILRVQPEGGKPLDVAAYLCGHTLAEGECFEVLELPPTKSPQAFRRT